MKGLARRFWWQMAPPVGLLVVVLLVWQMTVEAFEIKRLLLPSPLDVIRAVVNDMAVLSAATAQTAAAALCGFVTSLTLGTLIAFAFSQSRIVRSSCYPYAIFLQTVPIVAIAPLIINWSGYGFRSVVIVSVIISLFPIITNATAGLTTIDRDLLELFRLHNASRWQILLKLRLPNSVPYLIAGAKTSSGLAVIGAIVGEFFAGASIESFGLGYLVMQRSIQLKTAELFGPILASALLGIVVFVSVSLAGATILSRWYDQSAESG